MKKHITAMMPVLVVLLMAISGCSDLSPHFAADSFRHGPGIEPEKIKPQIEQRFLLIGDAGEDQMDEPAPKCLEACAEEVRDRTTIIFLGDNIYENGMPPVSNTFKVS